MPLAAHMMAARNADQTSVDHSHDGAPPVNGDVTKALAEAPLRSTGMLHIGGQEHFYLEGQVALAVPGEDGLGLFVHPASERSAAHRCSCSRPAGFVRHLPCAPYGRRLVACAQALEEAPLPWTIEDNGACFIVKDKNGQPLAKKRACVRRSRSSRHSRKDRAFQSAPTS